MKVVTVEVPVQAPTTVPTASDSRASFIWGTAFVAQSVGADHMGPYSFLAGRSWLACVFLLGLMAVLRKAGKTNSAAEPGLAL